MSKNNINSTNIYSAILKNYPDILNIDQLCTILDISCKTAYILLRTNTIESVKVGRAYRIPKINIMNYLNIF